MSSETLSAPDSDMQELFRLEQYLTSVILPQRKLDLYSPYKKQKLFHDTGREKRERLLRAGNQQGKSYSGAAEAAIHATGKYPPWWTGRRWSRPTVGWAAGVTGEVTRDTIQRLLIGPVEAPGTGMIPHNCVADVLGAHGVKDLADTILVRHVSGGTSRIKLKNFEQGRAKFQSDTIDWLWFDEEPPEDVYIEGLTRTNATEGIVWTTFTPLLGMSSVVMRFLRADGKVDPGAKDRADINMTIDDAEHLSPAQRQKIIDSYPAHEKEARIKGVPILGSGRIYPISQESIECDAFDPRTIPIHWSEIGGMDFGYDHPTAAVRLLYDPDTDTIYVTQTYRLAQQTAIIHAAALKEWGKDLPFAWPQDGLQHDKGSGEELAEQYRKQGLNMLPDHAQFENGSRSVEAGIADILARMQSGRFKVYRHLGDFWSEFLLYHRKEGKIVKVMDDVLDACRYAMMMRRYARYMRARQESSTPATHLTNYQPLSQSHIQHDYASGMSQHQVDYNPLRG